MGRSSHLEKLLEKKDQVKGHSYRLINEQIIQLLLSLTNYCFFYGDGVPKEIAHLKSLLKKERLKFRQHRHRASLKIKKMQLRYVHSNYTQHCCMASCTSKSHAQSQQPVHSAMTTSLLPSQTMNLHVMSVQTALHTKCEKDPIPPTPCQKRPKNS